MQDNSVKKSGMKVLVLGGDGMLGHQLVRTLSRFHQVRTTLRGRDAVPEARGMFTSKNTFFGLDVLSRKTLEKIICEFAPEVVINAVGIIKQRLEAIEAIPCIEVNALFPHRLQQTAKECGSRVIHLSTDCVFSGRKGSYIETDLPDAEDLYGRSKLLGEITGSNALTLRTSMIGRELKRKKSLFEWFLRQKGRVPGYTKAIFSGLTTLELSHLIHRLITYYPKASGLYHVSSAPISKHDLLCLIRNRFNLDIEVVPDRAVVVDRSLDATMFKQTFNYLPPTWETMIAELAEDHNFYGHLRH